ncbi:valine--tRNA ligase [Candidatus Kaiserbacteria bacterium]|nr:valine--tRNA ligase [Candidatus Kaiserbacteria bacterium]
MQEEKKNIPAIPEIFLSPYKPEETEDGIYAMWEKSGYFDPDKLPNHPTEPFTIIMPPPNANGRLHAGHGLDMTLKDIATRFARMRGKRALFLPGADHAGFETQVVYEKKLEKEGRSRFGMDPKQLYDEIYAFTLENKKYMEDDIRRLGTSCDWSREKFTLDPDIVRQVQDTFVKMHKDGLVYRGKRTINWCPKHQTSLSDVETESVEETTPFYTFKYGPFSIGTVRPETKFGDKYVVMHPHDKRYEQYKHGDVLEVEWINGPIMATIIKDEAVDPGFGTGVMTITPWHSQVDFEIATRHTLDMEQIIGWDGKLLPIAGEFASIKIGDARSKIVEKLKAKGLLEHVDENYKNIVKRCYKCAAMIEPQVKDQWFVKMEPLTKLVVNAVERDGHIDILPEYEKKILLHWMKNSIDWNISRQIVWGIRIPAWFKGNDVVASIDSPGEGWEQDPDTFDTWFSSGQWPLVTLGYPSGADFKTYYPTDLMETGADLVFKWVPRMIMFGLYLAKEIPFKTVYFHGMVNDANNKKMSKSKGNVVSPIDMVDKFGADALRMSLVVGNPPGSSTPLSEDKIKGYKHFSNKLWNIARFILSNTVNTSFEKPSLLPSEDEAILKNLDAIVAEVTKDVEEYRLYMAAEKAYHYVWHELADNVLEASKPILSGTDEDAKAARQYTLGVALVTSLKLLHPFMPFVTETIWQNLPGQMRDADMLMTARWPGSTRTTTPG